MPRASAPAPALDVLCAGEALWDLRAPAGASFARAARLGFAPGGAAVNIALHLGRLGLAAGLSAAVGADPLGEALAARIAARGVVTSFLERTPTRTGLVFLEQAAAGRRVVAYRQVEEATAKIPTATGARVLVLTGLTPSRAQAQEFRRAARATRRAGAAVVVDLNARRRVWANGAGNVEEALRLLADVDVVKGSAEDLANLGITRPALKAAARRKATVVVTDGPRPARFDGPFGAFESAPHAARAPDPTGAGDAFTTGIVAALVRAAEGARLERAFWEGAAREAQAQARVHLRKRR